MKVYATFNTSEGKRVGDTVDLTVEAVRQLQEDWKGWAVSGYPKAGSYPTTDPPSGAWFVNFANVLEITPESD